MTNKTYNTGDTLAVGFKKLSDNATAPTKAYTTDSGFDLYAAEDVVISPGETEVIPTDIAVVLPRGHEAQVRPRSGVTSRTKLRVQLGTIDEEYIGNIGIIVDNISYLFGYDTDLLHDISGNDTTVFELRDGGSYAIKKGDKLAQLVVQKLPSVESFEVTGGLVDTERGDNGYGSTGV